MFKANVALFNGSKQSLTGFDFLERFSHHQSQQMHWQTLNRLMKLLKFFSLLIDYIVYNVIM